MSKEEDNTTPSCNRPAEATATCSWTLDDPDFNGWSTECGGEFVLADGTPTQNEMRFCCYCGKPLNEVTEHAVGE